MTAAPARKQRGGASSSRLWARVSHGRSLALAQQQVGPIVWVAGYCLASPLAVTTRAE